MALFHFDDEMDPADGSWLMHSGIGDARLGGDIHWRSSTVDWNVASMSHLKILFGVVHHAFWMLQWPVTDIEELYCKGAAEIESEEQ